MPFPALRSACCVLTSVTVLLAAQTPRQLGPATASLSHEFTRVTDVRELSDGRVLVSDPGDRTLSVADFRTDRVRQVGREGQGPGEYGRLGALFPLPNDSSLLVDLGGSRFLLLHGDSIVGTVPASSPAHRAGATLPLGADGTGRLIATRAMGAPAGGDRTAIPRTDSVHLIRVHRATGASDTLADLRSRAARISVSGSRGSMVTSIVINPLAVGDAPVQFLDGWIAVVRADPYRVDWRSPDGRLTIGPDLGHVRRAPSMAEKRGAMARLAASRGVSPDEPATRDDWPDVMPPFLPNAVLAGADGRVWVRRSPEPTARTVTYDVIDRRGARTGTMQVSDSMRIAAVGRTGVYVVTTDGDGLQRLRRHPIP